MNGEAWLARVRGGIFGLALGEARASPSLAQEFHATTQMLAVARGLVTDPLDPLPWIGRELVSWHDRLAEAGITGGSGDSSTHMAILRYKELGDWHLAGQPGGVRSQRRARGNGCLARALPLTFGYVNSPANLVQWSRGLSAMTHRHPAADVTTAIFNLYALHLALGSLLRPALYILLARLEEYLPASLIYDQAEQIDQLRRAPSLRAEQVRGSADVVRTLVAALWCLHRSDGFEEALDTAAALPGERQAVCAVCGALAGIWYGEKQMPAAWVKRLPHRRDLEAAAVELSALRLRV